MNFFSEESAKFLTFPPIVGQIGAKPHFGRLILKDDRQQNYRLSALTAKAPSSVRQRLMRKWRAYWYGDQGASSMCTAYSFLHFFEHSPITHPRYRGPFKGFPRPVINPRILYCEAQHRDPWPGGCIFTVDTDGPAGTLIVSNDPYDGTSIQAMMDVCKDRGYISGYYWENRNVDNVVAAIRDVSPVIAGTNWLDKMMLNNPHEAFDSKHEPILLAEGRSVGGHAYLLDEVRLEKRYKGREIGVFNSWSKWWGVNGRAYMSLDTLEKLLLDDGEICVPTEVA